MYKFLYSNLLKRIISQKHLNRSSLTKIEIYVTTNKLKSLDEDQILDILEFIDLLTGQKPCITQATGRYVGSSKKFFFSCGVTLRKKSMFNFLLYSSVCAFPLYTRRMGRFLKTSGKAYYAFCFKDLFLFPNLKTKSLNVNLLIKVYGDSNTLFETLVLWKFPVINK